MSIFSAVQEFAVARQVLAQHLVPSNSRNNRRKALNAVINELSEDTFKRNIIVNQILKANMIDMSEAICHEYDSTKEQVDGILSWLPRMERHRGKLEKAVKKSRKQYALPYEVIK